MKIYIFFCALLVSSTILSQETLNGIVLESVENKELPLPGANVYWLNTTIGTMTDEDGKFSIPYESSYSKLVISYVGFKTDTLTITSNNAIRHVLQSTSSLDEVTITSRKLATAKSYLKATNTFTVSSDELLKAACCNLSESFETNPSIDVNFADAVTGARQIKMLGLRSPYILITNENVPTVRGAAQTYGLSFIPGTWVESIQITKGAGSVINGYESIAGQINAELVKPSTDNKLFVNLYAATSERLELNTHFNTKIGEKWSTGLYLHGNTLQQKHDVNNDGFLDMPLYNQINVMNRWQYIDGEKGIVSFINVRYLNDEKQAGQLNFNPDTDRGTTNNWGSEIDTERFDITAKLGYVNPEVPWQSLGFQTSFSHHNQDSYFGLNTYDIVHNSFYSNLVYNSIISDSRHKVKTGVSFTLDHYDEGVNTDTYERTENSIGGFFEYAYDDLENLTLTAGIRADQHNRFGFFVTPRFHLRYTPWEKSAFRVSAGRGIRSANIFAENQNLFSSSRQINITNSGGKIYGLDPEIAWNYGVSYLQGFHLFGRKGDITLDYYRTNFQNQVVVDWENPFEINFYNLNGKSYANSFQVELNYNAFEGFDLRTAYKFYDIKTDYNSGRLQKPLLPRHRFFVNAAYETKRKDNGSQWKFDATYNWLSEQRFPDTSLSAPQFQLPVESTTVGTLNLQVTKVFSPKFEIYVGGENVTNVRQPNPIISADNPFGSNFDSNFVYGPIFGSMYYAGLRYKIK
ncbi:TonB-dependent receptor [Winogradskyella jejuensis]|uniref:Outer membrane cobalamin receptor protein n=1 Tax=Winogradskyella jejuensis TaxID=1089305 RepID=A0A1M5KYC3_9FLAO|nr:TonB-dependent receptor [Winogradskyella jejuensis]SHG57670.1 Outer membrane cobalamin receptor protein [Winogradskyella jejuensis]